MILTYADISIWKIFIKIDGGSLSNEGVVHTVSHKIWPSSELRVPLQGLLKGNAVTPWSVFTFLPYGAPPFISISSSLEEVDANGRIHVSGLNKARFFWDVFSVYVIFISYTSSLYLSAVCVK